MSQVKLPTSGAVDERIRQLQVNLLTAFGGFYEDWQLGMTSSDKNPTQADVRAKAHSLFQQAELLIAEQLEAVANGGLVSGLSDAAKALLPNTAPLYNPDATP